MHLNALIIQQVPPRTVYFIICTNFRCIYNINSWPQFCVFIVVAKTWQALRKQFANALIGWFPSFKLQQLSAWNTQQWMYIVSTIMRALWTKFVFFCCCKSSVNAFLKSNNSPAIINIIIGPFLVVQCPLLITINPICDPHYFRRPFAQMNFNK